MSRRPLEEQFEKETVMRIRLLSNRFGSVRYPDGVSRYYALELQTALEAGALLASLCMGSSLLEIVVREIVLEHARAKAKQSVELQSELEAKKHVGFGTLLDALCEVDLFDLADARLAKDFYTNVRIPVLHGLPRRFVEYSEDESWADFRRLLRGGAVMSIYELESVLEDNALAHLDTVAGILERNLAPVPPNSVGRADGNRKQRGSRSLTDNRVVRRHDHR